MSENAISRQANLSLSCGPKVAKLRSVVRGRTALRHQQLDGDGHHRQRQIEPDHPLDQRNLALAAGQPALEPGHLLGGLRLLVGSAGRDEGAVEIAKYHCYRSGGLQVRGPAQASAVACAFAAGPGFATLGPRRCCSS